MELADIPPGVERSIYTEARPPKPISTNCAAVVEANLERELKGGFHGVKMGEWVGRVLNSGADSRIVWSEMVFGFLVCQLKENGKDEGSI